MMSTRPPIDCEALGRQAIRLCRRYIDEVVLPFGLCPWAAPALQRQSVEIIAITDLVNQAPQALEKAARSGVHLLGATAERPQIELVLLLYPRFELGRRDLDVLLRALRGSPELSRFVMAAFHPGAPLDTTDAERLVPFLRQSPDPMVQAVRSDVLDRIDPGRGAGTSFVSLARFLVGDIDLPPEPSPRERVAQTNLDTVRRGGDIRIARALAAIQEDRRQSYRALGYRVPT